jgi:hypothetical protein
MRVVSRKAITTAHRILSEIEDLCQKEYARIEECNKTIARSQALLEKLEADYIKAKDSYNELASK